MPYSRDPSGEAARTVGGWTLGLRLPRILGRREWLAQHRGHELRIVARGLLPAWLFIDGKLVDRRAPVLSTDRSLPVLSARLPTSGEHVHVVEVFLNVPLATRVAVRVGGRPVQVVEVR